MRRMLPFPAGTPGHQFLARIPIALHLAADCDPPGAFFNEHSGLIYSVSLNWIDVAGRSKV